MLIELKNLENMSVGSFEEQTMIGKVYEIIVSPEEAKLLGFLVKIGTFIPKFKIASMQDVVDIDQNGITVKSSEALVEKDEIIRISKILKHKFNLIDLPARNQKDQSLGRVSNALVETQSGDVLRLYLTNFLQNRVFERSQIVKMDETKVILKDEPEIKETSKSQIKDSLALNPKTEIAA